ncbi:MAG TPA: hypothetical protein ENN67_02910 [Firmicutes bacterium]|nr:hypothetical protein [Bacillota bacterium]
MYDPYSKETELQEDERLSVQKKTPEGDRAIAEGTIKMTEGAYYAFVTGAEIGKSEAWTTARLAGIQGAKKADELMLVRHSFSISALDIRYSVDENEHRVTLQCEARIKERTGAETVALVGCGMSLMVLADALRAIDSNIQIEMLHILRR